MTTALYYTDSQLDPAIAELCRSTLARNLPGGFGLVSVSLNTPLEFGRNIILDGERGIITMHRQIIAGLRACPPGPVFHCEHDVLYHPSHFEFEPPTRDTFYYNVNVWKWKWPDGPAVWADDTQQVSGLCADRDLLLSFYEQKLTQIQVHGFDRHYEPGLRQKVGGRLVVNRHSAVANVCIRHGANLTRSKWAPGEFRNPRFARGWQERLDVPGWDLAWMIPSTPGLKPSTASGY